jgi:hypothetical protein
MYIGWPTNNVPSLTKVFKSVVLTLHKLLELSSWQVSKGAFFSANTFGGAVCTNALASSPTPFRVGGTVELKTKQSTFGCHDAKFVWKSPRAVQWKTHCWAR